jgi:hypothetical protein
MPFRTVSENADRALVIAESVRGADDGVILQCRYYERLNPVMLLLDPMCKSIPA